MILIDGKTLMEGKITESILVKSFEEYQAEGGKRDFLDCYSSIKERAKSYENTYIMYMDQTSSGIEIPETAIKQALFAAQAFWCILSMWFHKPLRKVSFCNFDLQEFNRL